MCHEGLICPHMIDPTPTSRLPRYVTQNNAILRH